MKHLFYLLLILISFSFASIDKSTVELKLNVEGINTVNGNLAILVFNQKEGFPENESKAILKLTTKVTANRMRINLGKLPHGKYAIAIIHDANSNNTFDKNIIGIPKEAFGFSNVNRIYFGPPSFNEAIFDVDDQTNMVNVKLMNI